VPLPSDASMHARRRPAGAFPPCPRRSGSRGWRCRLRSAEPRPPARDSRRRRGPR